MSGVKLARRASAVVAVVMMSTFGFAAVAQASIPSGEEDVPAVAKVVTPPPAPQTVFSVVVTSQDTFSNLVLSKCGRVDWQNVAFPGRNKDLILDNETITIDCKAAQAAAAPTLAAAPAPAPVPQTKISSGWANPLPGHVSYCNFWQWRGNYNHRGEDIPAATGTPIHAVHAGNVQTSWNNGGGNMTVITHDGMAEVYMHQSRYQVRSGYVNAGDVIGYIGSTGDASGPHLHLEIQPNGPWKGVTSPDKWLAARGVYIGC